MSVKWCAFVLILVFITSPVGCRMKRFRVMVMRDSEATNQSGGEIMRSYEMGSAGYDDKKPDKMADGGKQQNSGQSGGYGNSGQSGGYGNSGQSNNGYGGGQSSGGSQSRSGYDGGSNSGGQSGGDSQKEGKEKVIVVMNNDKPQYEPPPAPMSMESCIIPVNICSGNMMMGGMMGSMYGGGMPSMGNMAAYTPMSSFMQNMYMQSMGMGLEMTMDRK